MKTIPNQKLDPRLQNLMGLVDDQARLETDLARGLLNTPDPSAPMEASELRKPALVILRSGQIPEPFLGFNWTRLVDNYFAVDVPLLQIEALANHEQVVFIESARPYSPMLDT